MSVWLDCEIESDWLWVTCIQDPTTSHNMEADKHLWWRLFRSCSKKSTLNSIFEKVQLRTTPASYRLRTTQRGTAQVFVRPQWIPYSCKRPFHLLRLMNQNKKHSCPLKYRLAGSHRAQMLSVEGNVRTKLRNSEAIQCAFYVNSDVFRSKVTLWFDRKFKTELIWFHWLCIHSGQFNPLLQSPFNM